MSSCLEHSIVPSRSPSVEVAEPSSRHRACVHRGRLIERGFRIEPGSASSGHRAASFGFDHCRPLMFGALPRGAPSAARRGAPVRPLFWRLPQLPAALPQLAVWSVYRLRFADRATVACGCAFFGRFWPLNRFLARFCVGLGCLCHFCVSVAHVRSGGLVRPPPLFAGFLPSVDWRVFCLRFGFPRRLSDSPSGLGRFWRSGLRFLILHCVFGFGLSRVRFFMSRFLAAVVLSASLAPRPRWAALPARVPPVLPTPTGQRSRSGCGFFCSLLSGLL